MTQDIQYKWPAGVISQASFCELVLNEGRRLYRDLPWRNTRDPYEIVLSEVMLQQTQVSRVLGRWERFLHKFPTLDALASASNSDVLEEWQGMGYNRRALALKRMAEVCSANYEGKLPTELDKLLALPGIGPSTAAGVLSFAYNRPSTYIETNVRTVFIHHLFPGEYKVSDKTLRPLVAATCPSENPRAWYYALLDYGTALKGSVGNSGNRSSSYSRQGKFEGSHRQKRAELLRIVLDDPGIGLEGAYLALCKEEELAGRPALERDEYSLLVSELVRDGFFTCANDTLVP